MIKIFLFIYMSKKRDYLKEFRETTTPKYQKRYIPDDLTDAQKKKTAKIIIERREGKSDELTPKLRRPRKSTFTTQFNNKYGGLKDKSIKGLSKYFKIQPAVLNDIYDKGFSAWFSSGSRLGINQFAWSMARVYKAILNIMKGRKTGELPKSEGHDKTLVEKAVNFNKYIPPDKKD